MKHYKNLGNIKKFISFSGVLLLISFLFPSLALAHVIVTPSQAGIGKELVFNVSVPNERQVSVSSVKLLIPNGVTNVIPTMLSSWNITTSTNNNSSNPEVTSILWTGNIPVGQREDFSFSAQVPGQPGQLYWKAFQTYADGTVVHWDQTPTGSDDAVGTAGPYSVTQVVNDLSTNTTNSNYGPTTILALVLSAAALIISIGSILMRKKR